MERINRNFLNKAFKKTTKSYAANDVFLKRLITFLLILTTYLGIACKNNRQDFKNDKVITEYIKLIPLEGQKVTISGVYVKHNPVSNIKRDNIEYLSGILMKDDTVPVLFLELPRPDNEQDRYNGRTVVVTGTYFKSMPRSPGEPTHTAKYSGSWIYQITEIKLLNE